MFACELEEDQPDEYAQSLTAEQKKILQSEVLVRRGIPPNSDFALTFISFFLFLIFAVNLIQIIASKSSVNWENFVPFILAILIYKIPSPKLYYNFLKGVKDPRAIIFFWNGYVETNDKEKIVWRQNIIDTLQSYENSRDKYFRFEYQGESGAVEVTYKKGIEIFPASIFHDALKQPSLWNQDKILLHTVLQTLHKHQDRYTEILLHEMAQKSGGSEVEQWLCNEVQNHLEEYRYTEPTIYL
jgi:hypothetical protein